MEAGLTGDGEPPIEDRDEFLTLPWDDFHHGQACYHDDGTQTFAHDYLSREAAGAASQG
ncbi:hypothetical protein [Streptomyces sp. NPDC026673]|uniref:hypothetical protein n=1 Tax=Streptomyces sp. NPDC026673 TaxID=3155724 RepID=UPI0033FE70FF